MQRVGGRIAPKIRDPVAKLARSPKEWHQNRVPNGPKSTTLQAVTPSSGLRQSEIAIVRGALKLIRCLINRNEFQSVSDLLVIHCGTAALAAQEFANASTRR